MSAVRLVLGAMSAYLAVLWLAALAARASGAGAATIRMLRAVTLPSLRPLVSAAAGVSFSAAIALGPIGAAPAPVQGFVERAAQVVPTAPEPAPVTLVDRTPVRLEPPRPVTVVDRSSEAPAPVPVTVVDRTPSLPSVAATGTWTVERGDSFWSIAEATVRGDADLVDHWRALIEANRDRLADPTNPDLLFAGQTLRLTNPR